MQVKYAKRLFFSLLLGLLLQSCVEDLVIHTEETDKVVVNCLLKNDSTQTLTLSRCSTIGGTLSVQEVKDVVPVLYRNDSEVGRFERKSYGLWELKHTPISGSSYRLEVHFSDGRILKATTRMPANVGILVDSVGQDKDKYFTQLTANNPCWIFTLGQNIYQRTDSIYLYPDQSFYLSEGVASDHPLADSFNQDLGLFEWNEQVTDPGYTRYLRLKPGDSEQLLPIPFRLQSYFNFVFFRTASPEYDQYLKTSLQRMIVCSDEDDPGIWFDEGVVFSNIENGVGIFGAYSDSYHFYSGNQWIYGK